MMIFNRRIVLLGLAGAASAVYLAREKSFRDWCLAEISKNFGSEFAEHSETLDFVEAFVERVGAVDLTVSNLDLFLSSIGLEGLSAVKSNFSDISGQLLYSYMMSTTIVATTEFGEPLIFLSLYDPYSAPCSNPLSSAFLPDDFK